VHHVTSTELTRDCAAVEIPAGTAVTLPAGTSVDITQRLGGSFTIHAGGRLLRIAAKDADALGIDPTAPVPEAAPAAGPVTEEQVWEVLRSCYDPEIPVNIVDLGLVYDLQVDQLPGTGARVAVKMTLTAPGCGMGGVIAGDAQQKILGLPGVADASVDIIWEPPWHHAMITEQGKKILGIE